VEPLTKQIKITNWEDTTFACEKPNRPKQTFYKFLHLNGEEIPRVLDISIDMALPGCKSKIQALLVTLKISSGTTHWN
jgi:hypothetical protein